MFGRATKPYRGGDNQKTLAIILILLPFRRTVVIEGGREDENNSER